MLKEATKDETALREYFPELFQVEKAARARRQEEFPDLPDDCWLYGNY